MVLRNLAVNAGTGALVGVMLLIPTLGLVFIVVGYFMVEHSNNNDNDNNNDDVVLWNMTILLWYKGLLGAGMGMMLQPLIVLLVTTDVKEEDDEKDDIENNDINDEEIGSDKQTETTSTTTADVITISN